MRFRLIYRDVHPVEDTLRLQKSGISIGKKESSGSVRDWPLSLHWSNTDPSERFTTETSERYQQFIVRINDLNSSFFPDIYLLKNLKKSRRLI